MAAVGTKYTKAEAIVGAMIAFCAGLFLLMLLLYGNISRFWRGRKEITVVFTQVTALRPDSPVRLNGYEVGRVKTIQILRLEPFEIARIKPAVKPNNLRSLPLTSEELQQIRTLPEEKRVEEALKRIENRTMIRLTLEVLEEDDPERYRVDDIVEIKTTLMGDVSVEISSGFGKPLTGREVLLGRPGDLLGNLAQGVEDVRDLLAELRDVIGPHEKNLIRETIANIRETSLDIKRVSTEMLALLKDARVRLNELSGQAQADLETVGREVSGVGAKARETLGEVDKTLASLRRDVSRGIGEAEMAVREYRELAEAANRDVVQELGAIVRENRRDLRETMSGLSKLQADLRESSGHLTDTISTLRSLLNENRPDVNRMLSNLRRASENLEEATYRIMLKPWELLKSPTGADQDAANLAATARRVELASRALLDLAERIRAVKDAGEAGPGNYAERMEQLVREIETIRERIEAKSPPTAKETFERKAGGAFFRREP